MYLKFANKVELGCSHHQKKKEEGRQKGKWQRYEVADMLTGLVVVNISQRIHMLGHQVIHLKYIQFLTVNYTLIKMKKQGGIEKKFINPFLLYTRQNN